MPPLMSPKQRANLAVTVFLWLLLAFVAVWRETGSFTASAVAMLLADLLYRRVLKPVVFDIHDDAPAVLEPAPTQDRRTTTHADR